MTATYESPYNLGNVAQTGLSQAFIDTDFTSASGGGGSPGKFTYNLAAGTPNQIGNVTAVPEPSTIATLAIGGFAGLGYAGRRKLRRKAA